MLNHYGSRSSKYMERCRLTPDKAVHVAQIWPIKNAASDDHSANPKLEVLLDPEDLKRLHEITTLQKFYPMSERIFDLVTNDKASFTFHVSPTEERIINHRGSLL